MLLLIPIVAIAVIVLDESFKRSQEQVIISEFATADVVSQSVFQLVDGQLDGLTVLAESEAVRSIDKQTEQAKVLMDEYRVSRPSVNGLFLLKNDLTVVAQSGGIEISTLPTEFRAAAKAAVQGSQATISDSLLLPSGEVEVIAIIVPVYANPVAEEASSSDGTPTATSSELPTGAIGAFYSVDRLIAGYQPPAGFITGSNVAIALVSSSGKIVSVPGRSSDPGQIFKDGPELFNAIKSALGGQRTRATFVDPDGLQRVTVAVPIAFPGNDWAVLVSEPQSTAFAPNKILIERALVALAVTIGLVLILAFFVAEWLIRPFHHLVVEAKALSTGVALHDHEVLGPSDAAKLSRTIHDMAERLRAQISDTESARAEIARQAELLRDLLRRTVRLQEDERRRIASDIHDAVSPLITGALYQAQAVRMARANGNGHEDENGHYPNHTEDTEIAGLREVGDLLERAMRELHDVIFDLRPPDLDDIGMVAAIQRHVDQVNRSGLRCTLEVIGEERRLSPEVRLAMYRIVQEALHNAIRHARADESIVRIEWLSDRMRVTIQDDGSGFETENPRRNGLGLMSMQERAASIGATLDIISRPGTGTAVLVERLSDDLDLTLESAIPELNAGEAAALSSQPSGGMIDDDVVDAGEEQILQ